MSTRRWRVRPASRVERGRSAGRVSAGHRGGALALAIAWLVLPGAAQPRSPRGLEPGEVVVRELEPGAEHVYEIQSQPGRFLRLGGEALGTDSAWLLPSQQGLGFDEVPVLDDQQARVPITLLSGNQDRVSITVRWMPGARPGKYRIWIAEEREARPEDGERVRAHRALARAANSFARRTEAELDEAIHRVEQVLPLLVALGDHAATADGHRLIAASHKLAGRLEPARDAYLETLGLYETLGDTAGQAEALTSLCWMHSSLGEPATTLELCRRALDLLYQNEGSRGESAALNTLAQVFRRQGEKEQALTVYRRVLEITADGEAPQHRASAFNGIGLVFYQLGETQKALDSYAAALPLFEAVGDGRGEATVENNLGLVYGKLGELERSLAHFEGAAERYQTLGDRRSLGLALANEGRVHEMLGDRESAIEAYDRSLDLARELGDSSAEATVLTKIGRLEKELGDLSRALERLLAALEIQRRIGSPRGEAEALAEVGRIRRAIEDPTGAIADFERALELERAGGQRWSEVRLLGLLARAERDRGRWDAAEAWSAEALETIEELRSRVGAGALRASYLASVQDEYEHHVDLLMSRHRLEPRVGYQHRALEASERGRARVLLETLRTARVELESPGDEDTAAETHRILRSEEIRALVTDGESLLLEYALGTTRSFLWVVSPKEVIAYELPPREDLERAAREVYGLVTARGQGIDFESPRERRRRIASADARLPAATAALSEQILGPAARSLERFQGLRLLVVAEGALRFVPFAVLPEPGSGKPLIERREVVSLPSASVLARIREGAPRVVDDRGEGPLLAVLADPVFTASDSRLGGRQVSPRAGAVRAPVFERLHHTREEAEAILALVPRRRRFSAQGLAASRQVALGPEVAAARIVHFATHAVLDSERPERSGVMLSLHDEAGAPRDGFLGLADIYDLELTSELVVLSACRTALGKEIRGEGLVGLTRGFMHAGVPAVVASLWSPEDRATAELMKRFYRALLNHRLPVSEALRKAKAEMRRETEWNAPYFWAAFTLQGEWRTRFP